MRYTVFIVLPAYNEEKSIGKLVHRISIAMDDASIEKYQIIAVNDGSSDGTLAKLQELQANFPIKILNHSENKGLGATLRDGLAEASRRSIPEDIIITMDADDTHSPGLILRMVRMIKEGHDVVIASRYREGSRIIGCSRFRRMMSYGASWLFRLTFPIPGVRDFTCGFRAYRAEVINNAINQYGDKFIDQDGFQCMVDVLLKLRKHNIIFGEIPFILRYDLKEGSSKMNIGKTVKNTLLLMLKRM